VLASAAGDFDVWIPPFLRTAFKAAAIVDVNERPRGPRAFAVHHDRPCCRRTLRHHLATVDNVLYDAFGQRIVSDGLPQSEPYRVIYEVEPIRWPFSSIRFLNLTCPWHQQQAGAAVGIATSRNARAAQITARAVQRHHHIVHLARPSLSPVPVRSTRVPTAREIGMPASFTTHFQAPRWPSRSPSNRPALLILAAIIRSISCWSCSRSYIHPVTILSTLPSAASARCSALMNRATSQRRGHHRLVLLIGIVKKNANHMIDSPSTPSATMEGPPDASHQACLLRFRPILILGGGLVGACR